MLRENEKVKSVGATLDFGFNWDDWLEEGESLVSYEFVKIDEGITLTDPKLVDTYVIFILSGGTVDTWYEIICRITTDASPARVDERTLRVYVTQR